MKKGFTLIELLAVVLMLGILTSIALPQYKRSVERARIAEVKPMLAAIYNSRERVRTEQAIDSGQRPIDIEVPFSQLDIEAKGRTNSGSFLLKTKNFAYITTMTPGRGIVGAQMCLGDYAGLWLGYNGNSFLCCVEGTGAPATTCAALGFDETRSFCTSNRFEGRALNSSNFCL